MRTAAALIPCWAAFRRRRGRIGWSLLASAAVLWGAGSALAIGAAHFPGGACRAPYTAWALTWPVWLAAPFEWLVAFEEWSFGWC